MITIVAEVITITSTSRVTCEKVPGPIVEIPSDSNARCDSGTMCRYHASDTGISRNDGTSHPVVHRRYPAFSVASLIRLPVISAHTPASVMHTSVRIIRLGQY